MKIKLCRSIFTRAQKHNSWTGNWRCNYFGPLSDTHVTMSCTTPIQTFKCSDKRIFDWKWKAGKQRLKVFTTQPRSKRFPFLWAGKGKTMVQLYDLYTNLNFSTARTPLHPFPSVQYRKMLTRGPANTPLRTIFQCTCNTQHSTV